jgi:nucleoside phosphorylase
MDDALVADDSPCRLAVITCHAGDAESIAARLQGTVSNRGHGFTAYVGGLAGKRTVVAIGRGGVKGAARTLAAILTAHRPQVVVAAGLASGLAVPAVRGNVLVATEVVNEAHRRLRLGGDAWKPRGVEIGPLVTLDRPVRSVSQKRELARQYAAIAADQHSFDLAHTCAEAGVPFVALCFVTDGPDDELPEDIQFLLERKSRSAKVGALAGTLMRNPSHLKHLWRMKEAAISASEKLADWVVRLAEDM